MPEKYLAGSLIWRKAMELTKASVGIYRIMYARSQG
jgi:hypothetical protein